VVPPAAHSSSKRVIDRDKSRTSDKIQNVDKRTIDARIRGERVRAVENIVAEAQPPSAAWWLSFADEKEFLGAVIVHANDFVEAVMRTHIVGINPGGECKGMPISAEVAAMIPGHWKNRRLTREECAQFDEEMEG
jgi:hypothetical protein